MYFVIASATIEIYSVVLPRSYNHEQLLGKQLHGKLLGRMFSHPRHSNGKLAHVHNHNTAPCAHHF